MPLVRLELRNEYRLGDARLYEGALKKDDSKAILDGAAVAGLVGLLRQLGDLAEFSADIFYDLLEQVTATSARRRKIFTRIQNIEFALPFVEKAVKGQTSHIHFAYVEGSQWHTRLQFEKSYLLKNELPYFMTESYEECREPPRLYLLDKFDYDGTGACLKRYSDPSYFRRVGSVSELEKVEGLQGEKKVQKRNILQPRNEDFQDSVQISRNSNSARFSSPSSDGHSLTTEDASLHVPGLNSELSSRCPSFGLRIKEKPLEENEIAESEIQSNHTALYTYVLHDNSEGYGSVDNSKHDSLYLRSVARSYYVTQDGKQEIVKPWSAASDVTLGDDIQDSSQSLQVKSEPKNQSHTKLLDQADILKDNGDVQEALHGKNCLEEVTGEADNYMDAHNTLDSDAERESEYQTKLEVNLNFREMQHGNVKMDFRAAPDSPSGIRRPRASDSFSNQFMASVFPSCRHDHVYPPQRPADSSPSRSHRNGNKVRGNSIHDNSEGKYNKGNGGCVLPKVETSHSNIMMVDVSTSKISVTKPSVQLWSNGGLLGVEPSKPIFNGAMHDSTGDHVSGSTNTRPNLPRYILETQKHESPTKSDAIFSNSGSTNRDAAYGAPLSAVSNAKSQYAWGTKHISSDISKFAQKNVANSLRQKGSVIKADISTPTDVKKKSAGTLHLNSHKEGTNGVDLEAVLERDVNDKVVWQLLEKPISSYPDNCKQSSPPIEEMNVSFQPMYGLENSKLQLKILNSSLPQSKEMSTFSPFQLLQGNVKLSLQCGSESDDDTFCRSCSYSPEDLPSPQTFSNSEMWENDDRSECKDHESCDSSPTIPVSKTSIHCHMELDLKNIQKRDTANGLDNYVLSNAAISRDATKLPGSNSNISLENWKRRFHSSSDEQTDFELPVNIQLPPPPPLPPIKWRVSQAQTSCPGGDEVVSIADNMNRMDILQDPKFSSTQQLELSAGTACVSEPLITNSDKKKQDMQRLNDKRNTKHVVVNKEVDLWEELLRQIRNKSYHLRSTTTSKISNH